MVKPAEVKLVVSQGKLETAVMIYAGVMVVATNFVLGVATALVLYAIALRIPSFATARVVDSESSPASKTHPERRAA
jgi:MFS superfamily sulfate permease-like transporter